MRTLLFDSDSAYEIGYRYGGHFGPIFANYFLSQNAAIKGGTVAGLPLNLKTLGIGNGLTVRVPFL